jgi:hypothetical protein
MELTYHPTNRALGSILGVYVTTLRRWQDGDLSELGCKMIGASNATEHARTLEQGTLGHDYRHEGPPCYLAHFFETRRPDVAAGIESLEQNLDWCFAYTFRM